MSTKTAKPKLDLFATAQVKPAKTSAASDDKLNINVPEKEMQDAITAFLKGREIKKEGEAMISDAESKLKPYGKLQTVSLIEKNGKQESFIMSNIKKESVMFIPMDSYKKLDADRYNYLKDTYGEELVEQENIFTINPEMIQKYGAQISEAIAKAKNIPDADKLSIIQKSENYRVKKGTIGKLKELAVKFKSTVATLLEEIVPTYQLKVRGDK